MSAAQAVGEYLRSPDDLLKLSVFRKKLEKEKASIDARLKTGVREQLDATRDGLRKLFGTRNNVQAIRDELESVDRLCTDPQNSVSTFDQISRVSMVHRNFEQTEEMINNLIEVNNRVDALEDMLDADRNDILGPAPNLLTTHHQITQLESFRNQTMHLAKKASPQSRETLARWFKRLNTLIEAFEEYLVALAQNILPIIRAGNSEVIVKLCKIAEIEGEADQKAIAVRVVKKAAKMDAAAKFRSMQADARVIKHYRDKIMRAIHDSVYQKTADAYERDERDLGAFFENIGWLYQDLIRIEDDVVPCFPPSWNIHKAYVREYHTAIDSTLQKLAETAPEASVLLAMHGWLKEYKKTMKELSVPAEWLEPPLLGGKEQSLIDDYLKLIVAKLDEWSSNLMRTEMEAFTQRNDPPEVDGDGQYCTQGAVILFQMVNSQADLAIQSGQGLILARVITDVNRVMRDIQARWIKAIDLEFRRQIAAKDGDEVPGGLVDYLIALANDQIKCADYTEALSSRLEPLVSAKYSATIAEGLNDAIDGFLDVAKKCTQALIDIIFVDLRPALKLLFQPAWYDGVILQIIETIRDYTRDYQSFLNPSLLDLLLDDLVDALWVAYLTALANAPKLRMPAASDRVKEDIRETFAFFSSLRAPQELEAAFEVVEMVLAMLEASKQFVFLSYWQFAKVHGPNFAFVEGLMKVRGDLDRGAVSEVMDAIKRKAKDENLEEPSEPTIMKKISVQSGFSRFLQGIAS